MFAFLSANWGYFLAASLLFAALPVFSFVNIFTKMRRNLTRIGGDHYTDRNDYTDHNAGNMVDSMFASFGKHAIVTGLSSIASIGTGICFLIGLGVSLYAHFN